MKLTVKFGQSIFDVTIIAYQDASRVFDLMAENPQIESLSADLTGLTLTYTPAKITQKEVIKTISEIKKVVTINFTQSLFDIALQYYGSAENVYQVIVENGLENIHADPTGINLKYTINNTYVPIYFRTFGKTVATKPIKATPNIQPGNFILRTDGGYLLRTDGGKFIRH